MGNGLRKAPDKVVELFLVKDIVTEEVFNNLFDWRT